MNTALDVIKINEEKFKFIVSFVNNGRESVDIPIDKLESSAEMVGFHLELNRERLEPIDFRMVSKETYRNLVLEPDESVSIEFIGTIEKRFEKYNYLSFKNASYQISPGVKYKVWFSLQGYISKPIEVQFIN